MSLTEAVSAFLLYCDVERGFSQNTVSAYRRDLGQFQKFIGRQDLHEALVVGTLQEFLAHMLAEKELSVATARRRMACLRAFSTFVEERYNHPNPFATWSPKTKMPKRLPRAVPASDVQRLSKWLDKDPYSTESETAFGALVLTATGVRISELCAIQAKDVSYDGSSVRIRGKGNKDRIVYISNQTLCKRMQVRRMKVETSNGPDAPIFRNSRGEPLTAQTFRKRLKSLAELSGITTRITPHSLRHTAATLLIEEGTDIRLVQRLLGHASISTTEIYTHVTDQALKKAIMRADTIGSILSG